MNIKSISPYRQIFTNRTNYITMFTIYFNYGTQILCVNANKTKKDTKKSREKNYYNNGKEMKVMKKKPNGKFMKTTSIILKQPR